MAGSGLTLVGAGSAPAESGRLHAQNARRPLEQPPVPRPKSMISDGTSSIRTTVASSRMPAARPVAKIVIETAGAEARQLKARKAIGAALVNQAAGPPEAGDERVFGGSGLVTFLGIRDRMKTSFRPRVRDA